MVASFISRWIRSERHESLAIEEITKRELWTGSSDMRGGVHVCDVRAFVTTKIRIPWIWPRPCARHIRSVGCGVWSVKPRIFGNLAPPERGEMTNKETRGRAKRVDENCIKIEDCRGTRRIPRVRQSSRARENLFTLETSIAYGKVRNLKKKYQQKNKRFRQFSRTCWGFAGTSRQYAVHDFVVLTVRQAHDGKAIEMNPEKKFYQKQMIFDSQTTFIMMKEWCNCLNKILSPPNSDHYLNLMTILMWLWYSYRVC